MTELLRRLFLFFIHTAAVLALALAVFGILTCRVYRLAALIVVSSAVLLTVLSTVSAVFRHLILIFGHIEYLLYHPFVSDYRISMTVFLLNIPFEKKNLTQPVRQPDSSRSLLHFTKFFDEPVQRFLTHSRKTSQASQRHTLHHSPDHFRRDRLR